MMKNGLSYQIINHLLMQESLFFRNLFCKNIELKLMPNLFLIAESLENHSFTLAMLGVKY